jgi:hypothetical protein
MKNWNQLTIIQKIFIKEKAMMQYGKRIHFKKPDFYQKNLNQLNINSILSSVLIKEFF